MTELAPPLQSTDNYVFFRAVSGLTYTPDVAAKVEAAFGEQAVAQTQSDMEAWVKGAIDSTLVTGTHYAEVNAANGLADTFVSTGGDADLQTGMIPTVERPDVTHDEDGNIVLLDPVGFLKENDKYPLELRPHEIRGTEAHVALVALCAEAKKDKAAEELWGRLDISTPSRVLHEATLAKSSVVAKSAAFLLRFF